MRYYLLAFFLLAACGTHHEAPPESASYQEIKPIIQNNCAIAGCHDNSNQKAFDEPRFKSSRAEARIRNGEMPLNRKLAANDKKALLDYFASVR